MTIDSFDCLSWPEAEWTFKPSLRQGFEYFFAPIWITTQYTRPKRGLGNARVDKILTIWIFTPTVSFLGNIVYRAFSSIEII